MTLYIIATVTLLAGTALLLAYRQAQDEKPMSDCFGFRFVFIASNPHRSLHSWSLKRAASMPPAPAAATSLAPQLQR